MRQIIIGFCTEGTTDTRFLESIIQRTFEDIAFECTQQVEILPLFPLRKKPGTFVVAHLEVLKRAYEFGTTMFCIHVDSDSPSDDGVYQTRINPLNESLADQDNICTNLVLVVPIQMIESWMLADKALLKSELGTTRSDIDLGIHRPPEGIADPKEVLRSAISVAHADFPKRRRQLALSDIYLPIGKKIDLDKLRTLSSFRKFEEAVRHSFRQINLFP
jgi:hypothetical protein